MQRHLAGEHSRDAGESVDYLLLFKGKLPGIGKVLPFAAAAGSEVGTKGLNTFGGRRNYARNFRLRKPFLFILDFHINLVARNSPFHKKYKPFVPGQPEKLRAHELALAPDPSWVVQGTNDTFGTPDEVRPHLPEGTTLIEVPGAHSYPRGSRSALTGALTSIAGMLPG